MFPTLLRAPSPLGAQKHQARSPQAVNAVLLYASTRGQQTAACPPLGEPRKCWKLGWWGFKGEK